MKLLNSSLYTPEFIVKNEHFEKKFNLETGWIEQRTGIKSRFRCRQEVLVSEIAAKSVEPLISQNNQTIEFLICVSSTPDSLLPSMANRIAGLLNLNEILCFDLMSGCAAFLQALIVARSLLESNIFRCGIIVAAEKMDIIIDQNDPVCAPIFGDAASSWLIEYSMDPNIHGVNMNNNNKGLDFLYIQPAHNLNLKKNIPIINKVHMDGQSVFKHAVNSMHLSIIEALKQANMTLDDIDYIIPHQANLRIINAIAKQAGINPKKILTIIQDYGNIVNASIPATLHLNRKKLRNKNIVLTAFGAGFNFGAMVISDFL